MLDLGDLSVHFAEDVEAAVDLAPDEPHAPNGGHGQSDGRGAIGLSVRPLHPASPVRDLDFEHVAPVLGAPENVAPRPDRQFLLALFDIEQVAELAVVALCWLDMDGHGSASKPEAGR